MSGKLSAQCVSAYCTDPYTSRLHATILLQTGWLFFFPVTGIFPNFITLTFHYNPEFSLAASI
jgi:hypothetical protein